MTARVERFLTLLWLVVAWGAVVAFIVVHFQIGLNNDTATLMHQTQKMLDGGTAYIDFMDVNPPLIYPLFAIPLSIANAMGADPALMLNSVALLVTMLCLWLSNALLCAGQASRKCRLLAVSSLAVACFGASFMNQLYGDREYLMLVLIMPLMLLYSPLVTTQPLRTGLRMAVAMLGGIGFCLKPYALTIYAMALLYRLSRRHSIITREVWVVGASGAVYLSAIALFFPAFYTNLLPYASEPYRFMSWEFPFRVDIVTGRLLGHYGLPAFAAIALLVVVARRYYAPVITYLLFLLAGTVGAYLLSGGWYYTQYPFIVVSALLAFAATCRLVQAFAAARRSEWAALLVAIAFVAAIGVVYGKPFKEQAWWDLEMMRRDGHPLLYGRMEEKTSVALRQALSAHPRFLWLGFNQWAPSILDTARPYQSVGRFDYIWPLPGIVALHNHPARFEVLLRWLAGNIAEDIRRHKPRVIIRDASPRQHKLPPAFNAVEFLSRNPEFATAMQDYTRHETIANCTGPQASNCAYQLFYRNDTAE